MKLLRKMFSVLVAAVLAVGQLTAVSSAMESTGGMEDLLYMEIPTVVTASMTEQSIDKVPGSVTVITENQIKLLGLRYLVDVFNVVPGFMADMETYPTMRPGVRGYGYECATVKVMVDGYAVNNLYGHNIDAYIFYSLDNVKQIEIIRGTGSSLYGTDALVGVINIITKKEKGTKVSVNGGELGRKGVNAYHASDPSKDFSYRIALDYFDETGSKLYYEKDFLTGINSYAPNSKNKGKYRYGAEVFLKNKDLSLALSYADSKLDWTEGYLNVQNPGDVYGKSKHYYADLQYLFKMSDVSSLLLKGTYDINSVDYAGQFFFPGFSWGALPAGIPNMGSTIFINPATGLPGAYQAGYLPFSYDTATSRYYIDMDVDGTPEYWPDGAKFDSYMIGEVASFESRYQTTIDKHALTAGLQYRRDHVSEAYATNDFNQTTLYKVPYTRHTGNSPNNWLLAEGKSEIIYALYGQDIFSITDKLDIVAGYRYDNYELAGDAHSPRLAVVWNAFQDHVIKLSYGKAFFAPNVSNRYIKVAGYTGDEKLKPETVQTYEVSFQNTQDKKLHYGVSLFQSIIDQEIRFDMNRTPSQFNESGKDIRGGEIEGNWKLGRNLSLWGNYSYNLVYDRVTKLYWPERNMANLGLMAQLIGHLNFSTYAHYVGREGSTANWSQVNTSLVYTGIENTEISLLAFNMFDDKRYSGNGITNPSTGLTGSDYPWEGRQILLKAGYKF